MALRVSTSMIYSTNVSNMATLQAKVLKTQTHIASNTRLLTPADDPVAAARVLDLRQGQSMNTQFASNRGNATDSLTYSESILGTIGQRIQDIQELTIQAGGGALSDEQRGYIATDLRNLRDELFALANSRDGYGDYIFGGFKTTEPPYVLSSGSSNVAFVGDTGQKLVQVDTARFIPVNESGLFVFDKIGAVQALSGTSSSSTLFVNPVVVDATLLTGNQYQVEFGAGGAYEVYDLTLDPGKTTPIVFGVYDPAIPITADGIRFDINGTPAAGDTVNVQSASTQSLFKTVNDLIALLETPVVGDIGQENLKYGLESANSNLATALDNILRVRASMGSRMSELEGLNLAGLDRGLQFSESISNLADLDYYQAISDLMQQQLALEAAQKTFVQISGLSLFSMLR